MRQKANVAELEKAPLLGLLLKYSWPALVAMSLNALYSVVDRFYIGHGCGESVMAGLTLTFPVMMLFGAFGVFVGAGHAALLSIKLGEKDHELCEKILGELISFKLIFFLVLPPLVLLNLDEILSWCGGTKVSREAFNAAKEYLWLVVFSHIFSHLAFGLSAMMRSEGRAIPSMMCMIVGFGLNLLLDPLFIFVFDLGIKGAAWATNIAMFFSFIYALLQYGKGKSVVKLRLSRIKIYPEIAMRATAIGFAPFLQHLLSSAINVSLAAAFAKWAVDESSATMQIASLGVFQGMMILVIMPIMGVQQGLQPIIGFNWGARNFARVRRALFLGFSLTTVLCIVACVIQVVEPLPRLMASMFVPSDNPALLRIASDDLRLSNCMLWCISLNIVATTFFQSIGKPMIAIVLSTLRQGFCILPVVWFLPYFMEDHIKAIWLSMPVSDVLCCLMTLVPISFYIRFLSRIERVRRGVF
jgi:Na+-driven multidrug efflux pump